MGSKVFAGVGHKLISCIHSWLHNESIYHSIPVSMYIHWLGLAVNEWLILLPPTTPFLVSLLFLEDTSGYFPVPSYMWANKKRPFHTTRHTHTRLNKHGHTDGLAGSRCAMSRDRANKVGLEQAFSAVSRYIFYIHVQNERTTTSVLSPTLCGFTLSHLPLLAW